MADKKLRKLKIVSNGRPDGTHVFDIESGEEIAGVFSVDWNAKVGELPYVILHIYPDQCELEVDNYYIAEKDSGERGLAFTCREDMENDTDRTIGRLQDHTPVAEKVRKDSEAWVAG